MSDRTWWMHALQWGTWFVLMTFAMGWLAKSRLGRRAAAQSNVLQFPRTVLIVGIVGWVFFVGLAVLSILYPNTTGSLWVTLIFIGFSALGAHWVIEFFYVRLRVERDGLHYRTLTGGNGFLRWDNVTKIRYSHMTKWFRIEGVRGEVVRVSAMLMSLPAFAEAILMTVPVNRIDPETSDILQETANGEPPSIWV